MRFVHAAASLNPPIGVVQQMKYEAEAAAKLGIDWTVRLSQESDLSPLVRRWPAFARASLLRLLFFLDLVRLSRRGHCIVLRHSHGDPFQFAASFFLRPYYTVHHTFEEAELAASNHRVARLLLILERTLGRRTVARARGIICVTSEIANHELGRLPIRAKRPVLIYPNGVLYSDDAGELSDLRGHQVEIVFLASQFFDWHGLDYLLESMSRSREEVVLHLAGVLPEPLLRKANKDPRIRVHGTLDPSAVGRLIDRSWVGLSSFGLAQKKMTEACTLKVREYLRAGLPVYAGHRDSALPADFPYFREGRADMASIVAYAREMRALPRAAVSTTARPYIDKQILLQRLHRSIEGGADPKNGPTDRPGRPSDALPR